MSPFETTIDAGDFVLRSRTMQIRFPLDEKHFGHVRRQIFLKCVANIEQIPNTKRQTSEFAYIQSDDLQNLRLINSQSLGECDESCYWWSFRSLKVQFDYISLFERYLSSFEEKIQLKFFRVWSEKVFHYKIEKFLLSVGHCSMPTTVGAINEREKLTESLTSQAIWWFTNNSFN